MTTTYSDNFKMYAANGVGKAIEWDGTNLVEIATGSRSDKPTRVDAHRYHLFLAYEGGSLQHSSYGDPYEWDVLTGAGEINVGEEITDLLASVSGALTVFARNRVAVLFGDDATNWQLKTLSGSAGAIPWTSQMIGQPIYLDSRGLRDLSSTDQFGDFNIGTITRQIEPLFRDKLNSGITAVASMRVREKDQYRLFFSDGTGISVYFGRAKAEAMVFDLGFEVTSACSGKDTSGNEILYVGSTDGFVYQLDVGTTFDGDDYTSTITLPFNNVGSPTYRKRWYKAEFEVSGDTDTVMTVSANYTYSDPRQPAETSQDVSSFNVGGYDNILGWEGLNEVYLDGLGRTLSLTIASTGSENYHIIHSATIYYSDRGQAR